MAPVKAFLNEMPDLGVFFDHGISVSVTSTLRDELTNHPDAFSGKTTVGVQMIIKRVLQRLMVFHQSEGDRLISERLITPVT